MERNEFQKELEYFDRAEEIIRNKLEKLYADKASLREKVLRERKDMWDENRHLILEFDDVIIVSPELLQSKMNVGKPEG